MNHVIFGAKGIVGQELFKALSDQSGRIRQVNRFSGNDPQIYVADLLNETFTIN